MELTFAPRGILQIDDARIVYRNFEGRGDKYNHEGDRNFSVVIPTEEMALVLREDGWNVKIKPAREEGDEPFCTLPVKLKFNNDPNLALDRGPFVYLMSGAAKIRLTEETVGRLDHVSIAKVDLDIRPYDWEINGDTGRTAYVQSIRVMQNIMDRFADEEYPEE